MDKKISSFYQGKKVFITGHTGFKGSWLSLWLTKFGADVYGYSKNTPTVASLIESINLKKHITGFEGDILDIEFLKNKVKEVKPDIVFHLAAQPLVTHAFEHPIKTFEVNILGTANVLEALRGLNNHCSFVGITSDKSYKNKEWVWGYRETDEIGGKDPYSASKACAEILLQSYYYSYFRDNSPIRLTVARAGNIIGGGDWATNRIVPDAIKAWRENRPVNIRSPKSVRPWQHVLEPIYGYLLLAMNLHHNDDLNGESFNFGPNPLEQLTVLELIQLLGHMLNEKGVQTPIIISEPAFNKEALLLKLNSEKALALLKWKPYLSSHETLKLTAEWYFESWWNNSNVFDLCTEQIAYFEKKVTS